MRFDAALVREQGVNFAVVAVKGHAVNSDSSRREAMAAFGSRFPGVPTVLMVRMGGSADVLGPPGHREVPRAGPGQRASVEVLLMRPHVERDRLAPVAQADHA